LSQIGRIYYNASNADGCARSNFTNDFSGDPDGVLTPIFLVDRGHCTFVAKVRNVERAGGSLAVIIDDTYEDVNKVIMSDDGTGTGIRIPAMLIGKKEGQILKDFLTKQPPDVAAKASLSAEFVMKNQDNKVKWELWYTSTNDKALDFIRNFREQSQLMGGLPEFTPHIVTWSCTGCDSDFKKKECLSNGRYCSMNHQGTYIMGKDILLEDLRQKCLFQLTQGAPDKWWQYIQYVHRMCYEEINENCSKLGHKEIGRAYEDTMKCVSDSFEGTNFQKDDNRLLKEEAEKWKAYGSAYWPAIMINERTYRGDMVPDSVVLAICSAFNEEPSFCSDFRKAEGIQGAMNASKGVTRSVLIFVVVFLVLLNIIIILLYRRCQNRELKQDMQLQVNSAVSQYFALSTRQNTSMA
jgi:hypothetical protein